MKESVSILISEEAIKDKVAELGAQISKDYAGEAITMVCALKGAIVFMADLARKLEGSITFDFVGASSYGENSSSTGKVRLTKDVDFDPKGKHVLLIEDILDTGKTMSFLRKLFMERGVASFKSCVLLDKPCRRTVPSETADYTGFTIPDNFVVGYGLDYSERYRNLPYIGVLNMRNSEE